MLHWRDRGISISFKKGEDHSRLGKFSIAIFFCFYNVLIRSCLFLIIPEILKICLYMLLFEPFHVYGLFNY